MSLVDRIGPPGSIVVIGTLAEGSEKFFTEYSRRISPTETEGATVVLRQRVERTLYGTVKPSAHPPAEEIRPRAVAISFK
jgi:hypothetical protein